MTLREIHLNLLSPFQTSFGTQTQRRILLVEVNVDGVTGWGEVVAGEDPFYSYETVETSWHMLRDFIWPTLKEKDFQSAAEVSGVLEPIRGHNMAKAGIESAMWDAEAKIRGVSLSKLLGGTFTEIACGVSIGIQPTIEKLIEKVEKELNAGYQRIKIKIAPGWEVEPVKALRERWPRILLMVDANSAFTLQDAPLLKRLDEYYLMMIEQPLSWDDIYSHVALQKRLLTPICLDEAIHSYSNAAAAIELGACKIINVKMGRVGGLEVSRKIQELCKSKGIPVWCGGMLESGIGRAQNIAVSSLPGFVLPGDVSASRRYWAEDIITPEVEVSAKGTIKVPTSPGIGFEPRVDRIERLTKKKEKLN